MITHGFHQNPTFPTGTMPLHDTITMQTSVSEPISLPNFYIIIRRVPHIEPLRENCTSMYCNWCLL